MGEVVKKYTHGDLTVIWKPDQCIHSTKCWRGLVEVFNPKRRPWVDMEGADEQRIMEQVTQCPSGALSYVKSSTAEGADGSAAQTNVAVEAMKNGPLIVYGNLSVKDSKGNEQTKSNVTAFCRCGASANKPFCDGSHIRVGFKDE